MMRKFGWVGAAIALLGCEKFVDPDERAVMPGAKVETSSGGLITKGEPFPPGIRELSNTALAKATNDPWIGVIPAGDPMATSCPDGWVAIRMDDEDRGNANTLDYNTEADGWRSFNGWNFSIGGLYHTASPARAGGNTWIRYCPRYTDWLPNLLKDYAVISASNTCPSGSYRFTRRFDNEDNNNHNSFEGDISPNVSSSSASGYTILNFCFVPGKSPLSGPTWHPELDGQIIFTRGFQPMNGSFGTDDEDDSNNNQFSSPHTQYLARMKEIIIPGGNTRMYFGSESPVTTLNFGNRSGCDDETARRGIQCVLSPGTTQCREPTWPESIFNTARNVYCSQF